MDLVYSFVINLSINFLTNSSNIFQFQLNLLNHPKSGWFGSMTSRICSICFAIDSEGETDFSSPWWRAASLYLFWFFLFFFLFSENDVDNIFLQSKQFWNIRFGDEEWRVAMPQRGRGGIFFAAIGKYVLLALWIIEIEECFDLKMVSQVKIFRKIYRKKINSNICWFIQWWHSEILYAPLLWMNHKNLKGWKWFWNVKKI